MIYIIISYLFCISYSFIEGIREANKSIIEIKPTVHNLQRLGVLLIISFLLSGYIGIYVIPLFISMILSFAYIHNGTYFMTRNKLTPMRGFIHYVGGEKLTIYIEHKLRTRLFILSIIILIITIILKIKN